MGSIWWRRLSVILVGVALVLQISAVFSPGWLIVISGNDEAYYSLFYRVECYVLASARDCVTITLRALHTEARQAENSSSAIIYLDAVYEMMIWQETLMILSIAITVYLFFVLIIQRKLKRVISVPIFTFIGMLLSALADGFVIAVTCLDIVIIVYEGRLKSLDLHHTNTYIGASYSIALMLSSVVILVAAKAILLLKLFKKRKNKTKTKKTKSARAREPSEDNGQASEVFTTESSKSAIVANKYAYSEKL